MYETLIAAAAASGAEFVTGKDLAERIASFSASSLTTSRVGDVVNVTVGSSDAGKFAIDLGKEGQIASVTNWYAWDSDSVFLPSSGGTFEITLGTEMADVTRISALPMRGDLLSVSGDGSDLDFSFSGRGEVLVTLRSQDSAPIRITGADSATLPDAGSVSLTFDTVGLNTASVDYLAPGTLLIGDAGSDILLGGSAADTLEGRGGNDILSGGGGDDYFVFRLGDAFDTILDFATGIDTLELSGFGFADAEAAWGAFVDTAEGLELTFGDTDRLLLAGLNQGDLSSADIVTDPFLFA
jgi:serralysin